MTTPTVKIITPVVSPVSEPIRVWMVKIRALLPKYRVGGELVKVGFEHEVPLGEAEDMVRRGLVEIVSDPNMKSTGFVAKVPRERWGGWVTAPL